MAKFEKVLNYINDIKIKKTLFGGYDRNDVYMKMNEIVDIFKEYMKDEQDAHKAQMEELNEKICALEAEKERVEKEKEKMKETYKEYCSNILHQYSDSLHTLSSQFAGALNNIAKLQQSIDDMEKLDKLELSMEEVEEVEEVEEKEKHLANNAQI